MRKRHIFLIMALIMLLFGFIFRYQILYLSYPLLHTIGGGDEVFITGVFSHKELDFWSPQFSFSSIPAVTSNDIFLTNFRDSNTIVISMSFQCDDQVFDQITPNDYTFVYKVKYDYQVILKSKSKVFDIQCTDYKEIIGADPDSFKIIDSGYTKDKNHVWYEADILEDSDPNSFVILNYEYSKDKDSVWYRTVKLEGADPNSLEFIHSSESNISNYEGYVKDKTNVYYNYGKSIKLEDADPKNVSLIGNYVYSNANIYYEGKLIDSGTEIPSKPFYDARYIATVSKLYYKGEEIIGADPTSIIQVEQPHLYLNRLLTEGTNYYCGSHRVEITVIDPELEYDSYTKTFTIRSKSSPSTGYLQFSCDGNYNEIKRWQTI